MAKISKVFRDIPDLEGYSINDQGAVHDSKGDTVNPISVGGVKKFRLEVDGETQTFKRDELIDRAWGEEKEEESAEEEVEENEEAEEAAEEDAAEEESEEEETEEEEEEPEAPAKTKKPVKKKAAKKSKGPGVIQTIFDCITKAKGDGVSEEDILKHLVKTFKEKSKDSMANTIKAQIGTKKSPCRMEREKDVKFKITEKKDVRYFKIK